VPSEVIPDGHVWLRVADAAWVDPLDAGVAQRSGQRWNPPDSFATLYLNEDLVTARINLRLFIAELPYGPEDLRDDTGPALVGAVLPRHQTVVDVHTPAGIASVGLPTSYPLDEAGHPVGHSVCQPIGQKAKDVGLRGVRCRSAQSPFGAGRELAWFPATARSRARAVSRSSFADWFFKAVLHRSCRLSHKWSGGALPNPAADADLPTWRLEERRAEARPPEVHEVQALLAAADAEDLRVGVSLRLLAATGMRRADACALLEQPSPRAWRYHR